MNYQIDFSLCLSFSPSHFLKRNERRGVGLERMGKRCVLFILMLIPCLLQAQLEINAYQFFSQALRGSDTLGVNEDAERLRFPWIEAYDLRMRTDEFNMAQNLYTFRITPSTLGKRKAQKALSEHLTDAPDFGAQEAFCNKLSDVYKDWLMLYLLQEEVQLLQAIDTIMTDRRRVFEKMAGAYGFDFQELLKLQTDESDLKIELHELALAESRMRAMYRIPDAYELVFEDFIDIEEILAVLQGNASDSLSIKFAETQYERELINKEIDLEIAESRQIFDFAQLRYEGPHTDLYRERLSVGVGFRIPNSGNRRLKIQELELKQKALDREQARDLMDLHAELEVLRQKLISDIQAFNFYKRTIEDERRQLQNLGTQITKKEGFDPLLLLDIEERHINTRMKAFKMLEDILVDYLRYMEESGRLCGETDRNFLKKL